MKTSPFFSKQEGKWGWLGLSGKDWVSKQSSTIKVTLTFTDGTTSKTSTQTAKVVYNTVTATADGYTDVYSAGEDAMLFGWVITGVPTTVQAPTAVIVK